MYDLRYTVVPYGTDMWAVVSRQGANEETIDVLEDYGDANQLRGELEAELEAEEKARASERETRKLAQQ